MDDLDLTADVAQQIREVEAAIDAKRKRKYYSLFPETGPLSRHNYPKAMEFFRAGKNHNERAMVGGNRTGKTLTGCYEITAHLTGDYPKWWEGKRFNEPISAWSCGTSNEQIRKINQTELLGHLSREQDTSPHAPIGLGTGMIPGDLIASIEPHPQLRNAVKGVWVKHVSGHRSYLSFLSYEQGREAFQGTTQHLIHLDEEAPMDIYVECLMRTLTVKNGGLILLTFTPLKGLSEVVLQFMPGGQIPGEQVTV
jgi:phage terminase large subunit-like protein